MQRLLLLLLPLQLATQQIGAGTDDAARFEIFAERKHNQNIGNLKRKLQGVKKETASSWASVRFEIIMASPAGLFLLRINSDGDIIANQPLKREQICRVEAVTDCRQELSKNVCEIKANARLSNAENATDYFFVKVRIKLLDSDDFLPKFASPTIEKEILENTSPGHVIRVGRATDEDSRGFASCHLRYRLVSCSAGSGIESAFRLVEVEDSQLPKLVELHLQQTFNREVRDSVTACISVADQRYPSRSTNTSVVVKIRDVNDNAPKWSPQQIFSVQIAESEHPDFLLQLNATDADVSYGVVSYKLITDTLLFYLDSYGRLKLRTSQLDFEKDRQHVLEVIAYDNGVPPLTVQGSIIVNVTDSNDNAPYISVNRHLTIVENNQLNMILETVTVTDKDSGNNALISCELISSPSSSFFDLRQESKMSGNSIYTLFAAKSFDREEKSQYEVKIICSDAGQPVSRNTTAVVHVTVTDLNDNPPRLSVSPMVFSTKEGNPKGDNLFRFQLLDNDDNRNSMLSKRTFELSGPGAEQFGIHHLGGDHFSVIAVGMLDRETTEKYNLSLVAFDAHSSGTHSVSTSVIIQLIDINDCNPEFTEASKYAVFSVMENASFGAVVGRLSASDRDFGSNGRVSYRLPHSADKDGRSFRIEENSGTLLLNARLEGDGLNGQVQYQFRVFAVDAGSPKRTGTASITVNVIDSNDNRPKFQSNALIRIRVACDQSQRNHFLSIDTEANDADRSEDYKKIKFRLAQQRLLSLSSSLSSVPHNFSVQEDSGQIFLQSVPELCQAAKYQLKLEVYEPGFDHEASSKTIIVSFEGGDRRPGQRLSHVDLGEKFSNKGSGHVGRNAGSGFSIGEIILIAVLLIVLICFVVLVVFALSIFCRGRRATQAKGNASHLRPEISFPLHAATSPGSQFCKKNDCEVEAQLGCMIDASNRYGSLQRQRRRNASLDEDEEAVAQPMQLHSSVSQQLPQERNNGYQKIIAGYPLSASENYMTCHFPSTASASAAPAFERNKSSFIPSSRSYSKMIDANKRPSEPSSLKSSYFTVSHV